MGDAATPRSGLIDEFLQAMEDQASEPMPVDRPVARQAQQRPDPVQVHPALTDFYIFCDLVTVQGADVRYSPNWNMFLNMGFKGTEDELANILHCQTKLIDHSDTDHAGRTAEIIDTATAS
ncbi:hypothetical protein LMH87_011935 [Akanthomyces muscarius]|uniref:Uncharacterized protein n=1 Tax=Akanthomyces muscarius TaxID=2231603 RepID=A0A9W8ULI2_AKAMU|nr:hypothetical protein LMH87_011935 [Akanthomyces muscarius]KAJ4151221.1 hypothetical protein LMH87_011935 [Akanthomyces muscarius]